MNKGIESPLDEPAWRVEFLGAILKGIALGGLCLAVALGVAIYLDDALRLSQLWLVYLLFFSVVLLNFFPNASLRGRALVLVLLLHPMSWNALIVLGVESGPLLSCFISTLVTALLVSRSWAAVSLVCSSLLVGYARAQGGAVDLPAPVTAFGFAGATFVGVVMVLFLVATLERHVRELRENFHALDRAQAQRRQAEEDLESVRAQLEDVQRFESIGRVAGGVAHEFNNLLQIIMAWSEEIEANDEEQQEVKDNILQATLSAGAITSDLLTVARRASHKAAIVDVSEYFKRWVPSWRRVVPDSVALEVKDQHVGHCKLNASALAQALLNLIRNAADPSVGASRVTVELSHVGGAERPVRIVVSDDGCGIAPEALKHVFEPFYSSKGERGTGLGLSIVRGTIEQFGGRIGVESVEGVGSRFEIRLPTVSPEASTESMERRGADVAVGRLLFVEDEPKLRGVMQKTLTREGFDFDIASDGSEAMNFLRNESRFDLLCIDARMPGVPTVEVVEYYQTHFPLGRVIVCSGNVRDERLLKMVNEQSIPVLTKPYTVEAFYDVLKLVGHD